MATIDLIMPKMGESIMEATILKWHKKPGDSVKMDETILEIATDKVDSEVPSTADGIISEILFKVDDVVPVDTVIAKIETNSSEVAAVSQTQKAAEQTPAPAKPETFASKMVGHEETASPQEGNNRFYSPLVLNIASKEGINISELENMAGSGKGGRVTKSDILKYIADKKQGLSSPAPQQQESKTPAPAPRKETAGSSPAITNGGNVEIIEMDRMRKLIAEHMVRSKAISPHVTSFTEADVTNIVKWRQRNKQAFQDKYGEKITFTPIFLEAIVNCIRQFPMINISVDGTKIIVKKDINIGMATALPSGNLIVPVIKNADTKNLLGLSKDVNRLANDARNNNLKVDDTQGGTFTVTNVGTFGSLMGTPIINQPQVAILAVGTIKKRPMVLETADGDVIAIRHMMYLSLSYDHRVVDGSLGASFLTAVANELEAFDANRKI